jgi:hypothetical protein
LDDSVAWKKAQEKGQSFLYFIGFDEHEGVYMLSSEEEYGGDYFNECDFRPYADNHVEKKTPETVVKKCLYDESGNYYGEVGKKVEGTDYHIGDIVAWHWIKGSSYDDFEYRFNIIADCTPHYPRHPFVMGLGGYDITNDSYKKEFVIDEIIIPYDQVNEKHLKYVISSTFEIREVEEIILPKLTLAEVKEIVGYDFDLVEE